MVPSVPPSKGSGEKKPCGAPGGRSGKRGGSPPSMSDQNIRTGEGEDPRGKTAEPDASQQAGGT